MFLVLRRQIKALGLFPGTLGFPHTFVLSPVVQIVKNNVLMRKNISSSIHLHLLLIRHVVRDHVEIPRGVWKLLQFIKGLGFVPDFHSKKVNSVTNSLNVVQKSAGNPFAERLDASVQELELGIIVRETRFAKVLLIIDIQHIPTNLEHLRLQVGRREILLLDRDPGLRAGGLGRDLLMSEQVGRVQLLLLLTVTSNPFGDEVFHVEVRGADMKSAVGLERVGMGVGM